MKAAISHDLHNENLNNSRFQVGCIICSFSPLSMAVLDQHSSCVLCPLLVGNLTIQSCSTIGEIVSFHGFSVGGELAVLALDMPLWGPHFR